MMSSFIATYPSSAYYPQDLSDFSFPQILELGRDSRQFQDMENKPISVDTES